MSPSERAGGGKGEKTSRGIRAGVVQKLRICGLRREAASVKIVHRIRARNYAGFCSARVITRTPHRDIFLCNFLDKNKLVRLMNEQEKMVVNFCLNELSVRIMRNIDYELRNNYV